MTAVAVHPAITAAVAALRAGYPAWHFIISDEGRIWAQRQRGGRVRPWAFDCHDTDTPAQMRACLARHQPPEETPCENS